MNPGRRRSAIALVPALWLAAACALPTPGAAQVGPAVATDLQQRLEAAHQEYGYTGAAASVLFADGSMWSGAAGLDDKTTQSPLPADGLFGIMSITKSYVAATILLLQEEGRLSLQDSVERWLPGALPTGADITIEQLLNHTSGLRDFAASDEFFRSFAGYSLETFEFVGGDLERRWRPEEMIAFVATLPARAPGGRRRTRTATTSSWA